MNNFAQQVHQSYHLAALVNAGTAIALLMFILAKTIRDIVRDFRKNK